MVIGAIQWLTFCGAVSAIEDGDCLTLSGPAADTYARCVAEELANAIQQNGQATKDTLQSVSDQCLIESVQTQSDWVR